MRQRFCKLPFAGLLLLVAVGLSSGCQRASYAFQGSPAGPALIKAINFSADTAAPAKAYASRVAISAPPRRFAMRPKGGGGPHHGARRATRRAAAAVVGALRSAPEQRADWPSMPPNASGSRPQAEPRPYHKGVAFALAVLLGFTGAHLFYLGNNREGFRRLTFTLIGLALLAIAVPVGMSSAFGAGFGGVVITLYLLIGGLLLIGAMYSHALLDAVLILTGGLAP
jgi:TM2 domain-containing membrane protein YozV